MPAPGSFLAVAHRIRPLRRAYNKASMLREVKRLQRIAVEQSLNRFAQVLQDNGYEVVQLDPLSESGAELINCAAVVVSGMDRNMLGRQDIQTAAPVIDATGLTSDQLLEEVRRRAIQ